MARPTLRVGSSGPDVAELCRLLNVTLRLDPPLPEAQAFDDAVDTAVKQFQGRWGLDDDGVVGGQTWDVLELVGRDARNPLATALAVGPPRLGNLEHDLERMGELMDHLVEREGIYHYFYCDHNGLVTIGIGHLVDQTGAADAVGQRLSRELADEPDVDFRDRNTNVPATVKQVEQDWQRIKNRGRTHPGGAASFADTARLRITDVVARRLSQSKVQGNIDLLYRRRPFTRRLDSYLVMAFVDVLYNPSGVALFREERGANFHRDIPALWAALNPDAATYDLEQALDLFRRIWINRGVARYHERHRKRVEWFRKGVRAMQMAAAARRIRDWVGGVYRAVVGR